MKTLEMITEGRMQVPMTVSWYLSDIGRAQGIQDLYTRQAPQKLKVLREHAIAQSVVSSNRIEGVLSCSGKGPAARWLLIAGSEGSTSE